jgi:DNA helicase II / ATP-dependent DNA helicase PcrA
MNYPELLNWLKQQQSVLDEIIALASDDFYQKHKDMSNFTYDVSESHDESYNLVQNKDLCYDRPTTAFTYSLWYHGRRVNTFLSFFAKKIISTNDNTIEIFDLGAGAGAIQWAVGLVFNFMRSKGMKTPTIKIINVDTSPFMLAYNRDYLWRRFLEKYSFCQEMTIDFEVNSWNNGQDIKVTNPWLAASYLFDITDDKDIISKDFVTLVKLYKPKTVLLLTSAQPQKEQMLSAIEGQFKVLGYSYQRIQAQSLIYLGALSKVNAFREKLFLEVGNDKIKRPTNWFDQSFTATILEKQQSALDFHFDNIQDYTSHINLYSPPLKVRRDIQLNEQQKKASKHSPQPAVIIGPAGCGKSIVITERIKNIVEEHNYDPNLKILVSTFNKELVRSLGNWITDLLAPDKFSKTTFGDGSAYFKFTSDTINIYLLHFEMLAKRIGGIHYHWYDEAQHKTIISNICIQLRSEYKEIDNSFDSILTPEFILEEYHRVIYGLECYSEKEYLEIIRKGRGNNPTLRKNSLRRKIVLECIKRYNAFLVQNNQQSYITRRRKLLRGLENASINTKFDYVLVDEFQDCTNADFKIFINFLKNSDNLIISGDLAQSVHIGKSSKVYRDISMGRREFHRLKGSYRLPVRISECIEKIPKHIAAMRNNDPDVHEITPYKGSPPGARPIVVYAETLAQMVEKIKAVFLTYKIYDLNKITILERDNELCRALNQIQINSETDTILRLKGLEKECILWDTRIKIEFHQEVYEFVYTILTRTSSILIIALSNQTVPFYKPIINSLRRDRLILWDIETKTKFNEFCVDNIIEVSEDEDEDDLDPSV